MHSSIFVRTSRRFSNHIHQPKSTLSFNLIWMANSDFHSKLIDRSIANIKGEFTFSFTSSRAKLLPAESTIISIENVNIYNDHEQHHYIISYERSNCRIWSTHDSLQIHKSTWRIVISSIQKYGSILRSGRFTTSSPPLSRRGTRNSYDRIMQFRWKRIILLGRVLLWIEA